MKELILQEQVMGSMTVPARTYPVADIKAMIAPNATDSELGMFCQLAAANQLDPFKREIYFIKYGGSKPSYVTGYQVYLQRAAMSGKLDGWEVVINEASGKPASATITIYRNDMTKPVVWTVLAAEFDKGQANWKSMPSFMLQKVAIGQGFRLAFPEYLSGMPYLAEEITANAEPGPGTPVDVTSEVKTTKGKKGKATTTRKVDAKPKAAPKKPEAPVEPVGGDEPPPLESYEGGEGEGEGENEAPAGAEPPVPEGVDAAPSPALMDPEKVTAMLAHFSKQGITEEIVTAVLECPRPEWTESHRVYLQSAWYKLTDQDPAKKMSLEDFSAMRYASKPPF